MHTTEVEDTIPNNANINTSVFSIENSIQSCTAHGEIKQIQKATVHHTKVSRQQSSQTQADKLVVTPVNFLILRQFLEGYDDNLKTFLSKGFQQGFEIQFEGPRQQRFSNNLL